MDLHWAVQDLILLAKDSTAMQTSNICHINMRFATLAGTESSCFACPRQIEAP